MANKEVKKADALNGWVIESHYVNPDCVVFVWADREKPNGELESVVATGDADTTRTYFDPVGAFVQEPPPGYESRRGRFIQDSPPINKRSWDAYIRRLVKEQHADRERA